MTQTYPLTVRGAYRVEALRRPYELPRELWLALRWHGIRVPQHSYTDGDTVWAVRFRHGPHNWPVVVACLSSLPAERRTAVVRTALRYERQGRFDAAHATRVLREWQSRYRRALTHVGAPVPEAGEDIPLPPRCLRPQSAAPLSLYPHLRRWVEVGEDCVEEAGRTRLFWALIPSVADISLRQESAIRQRVRFGRPPARISMMALVPLLRPAAEWTRHVRRPGEVAPQGLWRPRGWSRSRPSAQPAQPAPVRVHVQQQGASLWLSGPDLD